MCMLSRKPHRHLRPEVHLATGCLDGLLSQRMPLHLHRSPAGALHPSHHHLSQAKAVFDGEYSFWVTNVRIFSKRLDYCLEIHVLPQFTSVRSLVCRSQHRRGGGGGEWVAVWPACCIFQSLWSLSLKFFYQIPSVIFFPISLFLVLHRRCSSADCLQQQFSTSLIYGPHSS